jgi:hypothetical protein
MPKAIFYLTYNGIYNFTNGNNPDRSCCVVWSAYRALERQYGPIHLPWVSPS